MKASRAVLAAFVLSMLAWSGSAVAEEDPAEGRVKLKIQAGDPDGGELSFLWVQKEGRTVKIANPTAAVFDAATNKWVSETYFVPTEPDTYVFEVTVSNKNGLSTTKRFSQEVLPPTPLPVANPGSNQKTRVGQKVVLSGQDSKAFNNRTITKYQWTITEAPGGFVLTPDMLESRQVDFLAKLPGKYVFSLKVFDSKRWGDPATVEVEVTQGKPPQVDPIEEAGPVVIPDKPTISQPRTRPKAVAEVQNNKKPFRIGDTIVLDGSNSVINEADSPKFLWKQIDDEKSPKVKLIVPDVTQPFSNSRRDKFNFPIHSFNATENGIYKFVLLIDCANGVLESEPVTIQVGTGTVTPSPNIDTPPDPPRGPKPPVARLTANKTEVAIGDEVTLDGSKSSSDDGAKLTYIWAPVPGKRFPENIRGIDGPIARFSAEREGEFGVSLLVSDGRKQGVSEPIIIKVLAAEKAPVIELEPTQKCNLGEKVVIEAKIRDESGGPLKILWTCLEPKTLKIPPDRASAAAFTFATKTPGTYMFQIEVTNAKGLSATARTQVGVKDAAQLKPTAVITGQERASVGDTVKLSAAQSFSPNKTALTYRWADESDGGPKIKDPMPTTKKQDWTFKVTEPGRHLITLIVNDGSCDSEPSKFAVDVAAAVGAQPTPPKAAKPVAKITGPKTAQAKTEVELSGEGSTGDGTLQFYWAQQVDGGPFLGLTGNQRRGRVLRFIPEKAGMYTFTLEIVDQNNQRSETETFAVDIKAAAAASIPTAVASIRNKNPLPTGREIRLTGERSSDPSGAELRYKWKQTNGPSNLVIAPRDSAQEIVITPTKPGAYDMELVVSNGEAASAPATVSFTVVAGALPQAIIAEIAPPSIGDTVVLDGSGSKSPNGATGDQLKFYWLQKQPIDVPVKLQIGEDRKSKIQFVVPAEGTYVWELVVNDGNDDSAPTQITFQARPRAKNIPPVAIVERPVITTEVGVQTVIDASASNDPDKGPEPLTFRWRRGNHELDQRKDKLSFMPAQVGVTKFEVQAFDGKDFSEPVQVTVNVVAPGTLPVAVPTVTPNPAPAANRNAPADPANPLKNVIILDGTKSRPQGKELTYTWRQISGDNLKLAPANLAKDRVGIRIYKAGDYKFELIVSDGENASVPATVELKVIDADGLDK